MKYKKYVWLLIRVPVAFILAGMYIICLWIGENPKNAGTALGVKRLLGSDNNGTR